MTEHVNVDVSGELAAKLSALVRETIKRTMDPLVADPRYEALEPHEVAAFWYLFSGGIAGVMCGQVNRDNAIAILADTIGHLVRSDLDGDGDDGESRIVVP